MNTRSESRTVLSTSLEQTLGLGERLGGLLAAGDVLALVGPLGAGKTWFVKGIAAGLEVSDVRQVRSPTFVLVSEYEGRLRLYHVDAYRLTGSEDLESLGSRDFIFGDGVTVLEWADRVVDGLPKQRLTVTFEHVDPTTRRLTFTAVGERAGVLLHGLGLSEASS